jgi:predicted Zn-dependent protease with MMP-like domain
LSDGALRKPYDAALRLLDPEQRGQPKLSASQLATLAIDAPEYEIPNEFGRHVRKVVVAIAKAAKEAELLPAGILELAPVVCTDFRER